MTEVSPVARTGRPLRLSGTTLANVEAERSRNERAGIIPNTGQTWRRNTDNTDWTIAGRKTSGWVLTRYDDSEDWQVVTPNDLVDCFSHLSCSHDTHCCYEHETHSSPHRGCILR